MPPGTDVLLGLLTFVLGFVGLGANITVLATVITQKLSRNSFNLICCARAFVNTFILFFSFIVVIAPVILSGGTLLDAHVETILLSVGNCVYLANSYLSALLAVNRFVALYFPLLYAAMFSKLLTTVAIILLFVSPFYDAFFAVLRSRECIQLYNVEYLMTKTRGPELCFPAVDILVFLTLGIAGSVVFINVLTFARVIYFYKNQSRSSGMSRAKIRANIKLYFQTLLQDVLYAIDITFTFKLGRLFTTRIWGFISSTLVWESVHTLDGIIMACFGLTDGKTKAIFPCLAKCNSNNEIHAAHSKVSVVSHTKNYALF